MSNSGQILLITDDATDAEANEVLYTNHSPVEVNLTGTTVDREIEEILIDLHQKHGLRLAQLLRML